MKKLMMALGVFMGIFLFLSINLSNKPLFSHVYRWSSHLTIPAQNGVEFLTLKSVSAVQGFGKMLFNNSLPQSNSRRNTESVMSKSVVPTEDITEKERDDLNDLIKE